MKGFKNSLMELFNKVSDSSIADESEGAVLYFIQKDTQRVLSLSKLKTLEYRVWRKLREKLKNAISHGSDKHKKISQFVSESKELAKGHSLPQPMDY